MSDNQSANSAEWANTQPAEPSPSAKPVLKLGHHVNTVDLVRHFHETFKHPVAKQLTVGDAKLRRLRVQLVLNELAELAQALGVPVELEVKPVRTTGGDIDPKHVMNGMLKREWVAPPELCYSDNLVDMVETADAFADLDVVVNGGMLALGIPAGLVAYEVYLSNMSKLDKDGQPIYDANGKIVKSDQFREPDIKTILETFVPATELL